MNIVEVLEKKLTSANEELETRKNYFLLMVNNEINTSCFEKNAINELLVMMECKNRIKTIEADLMTARIYSENDK